MTEADYHKLVRVWLRDTFSDIEHEPTLPDTGRVPDFVVHTPFESYVVEVENSFEDVYEGIGQVMGYKAATGCEAIVVIPPEVEEPEYSQLQTLDIHIETV